MALHFSDNEIAVESPCIDIRPPDIRDSTIFTCGRDARSHIHIDYPTVSRHHCEFLWDGHNWSIADCGSTFGTWVYREPMKQGHWLAENDWFPLVPGTKILFGGDCGIRAVWLETCEDTVLPPDVFQFGWPDCQYRKPKSKPVEILPEIDTPWELAPWFAGWVEYRFGKIGVGLIIAIAIIGFLLAIL